MVARGRVDAGVTRERVCVEITRKRVGVERPVGPVSLTRHGHTMSTSNPQAGQLRRSSSKVSPQC